MNNTEIGNGFRSHVLDLLKTKFKDATTETLVSWKKSDIVFTMMDFGKRVRVAVECKCYNKKLTTSDFAAICRDYDSAFTTQEIATLIIVSRHDIEAASKKFLEDTPRLRFLMATELEEWLTGLRPYIEGLTQVFRNDDVSQYYINSRATGFDAPAFDLLRNWIQCSSNNGIAILGGYGLGKSSLAKRLAADQAQRYLENPSDERMPILLRLGQVVHETELSGLFGKEFTAENAIEGYSFSTLMHLNENGRLLIILDGFDEMKHAMTEFDFKANFREFNKLRKPKAKVLLLGRPNAFTSESAALLIKGMTKMGGQEYSDNDFPAWEEMNLEFFSLSESKEFLSKYLHYVATKQGSEPDQAKIDARVMEIIGDVHHDILQRPVQARIVGQLAASETYSFKNIDRFRLYDDFVERMIGRDQEKRARRVIPSEARRDFLESLSWWAWTRPETAQSVFRKDEVPQSIFDQFPNGEAISSSAKRSEYLVSSLTEHKDSDVLYFAHRSFQEFLVASSIAKRRPADHSTLIATSRAITQDVYSFLKEVEDKDYLVHLYELLNPRLSEIIRVSLFQLMQSSEKITSEILSRPRLQCSHYDVAIAGLKFSDSSFVFDKRVEWLLSIIRLGSNSAAECALYVLFVDAKAQPNLIPMLLAASFERILMGVDSNLNSAQAVVVGSQYFGGIGLVIRDLCSKVRNLEKKRLSLKLDETVTLLNNLIKRYGIEFRLEPPFNTNIPSMYDFDELERFMSNEAKKLFNKLYLIRGDSFELVARIERTSRNKSAIGDRDR